MIEYTIFNAEGVPVSWGTCQPHLLELQAQPGQTVKEGLFKGPEVETVLNYTSLRRAEYPPIEDFIDAMYWHLHGKPEKLDEYFEKVAEIKAKFPKNNPV